MNVPPNGTGPAESAIRALPRRDIVFAVRRTAPARRRLPWRRWLAGAVIAVALGGAGWWVSRGGTFDVTRVGTGDYRFTDERALKASLSPLLGRNLWALGPAEVKQSLAGLPWVREVYVQRRLPGTIDLELIEWRPLLVIAETGAPAGAPLLVLVEDGRVLPFPAQLPPPDLPVLTGVLVERKAGSAARLPASAAPAVLELVAAMEASGLEAVAPVDFVVTRPEGYAIVLQSGRGTLLVGREEFADRLHRFLTARDHVNDGLEVDLRFRERLAVRPLAVPGAEEAGDESGADGAAATQVREQQDERQQEPHRQDNRHRQDTTGAGRRPAAKERA